MPTNAIIIDEYIDTSLLPLKPYFEICAKEPGKRAIFVQIKEQGFMDGLVLTETQAKELRVILKKWKKNARMIERG